ncbi:UDP-glycosyltransferase UGT5-like [Ostrinia nubilalis]|uniref:UDP-glycosyltransferase UGT5-like n=1 Tax=Ostrinia nubilalis TaxID=29057 RepID=UPI0030822B77
MWSKIIIVSLLASHVCAINILAIVSIPLKSHYMAFKPLFREFAKRGHNVTVINHFPDEEPLKNLRFVDINGNYTNISKTSTLESYENAYASLVPVSNFWHHLVLAPKRVREECDNLFLNENASAHLAEGNKYDVVFVEQFLGDCGLVYAATQFDAPIIGITSHVLLPWAYRRLGIPFNPATDAFYFLYGGSNPSLLNKVQATIGYFVFNVLFNWHRQQCMYDAMRYHQPQLSFDFESLVMERTKMMFSYQHHSITGARLLAPQLLEIAGAHISKPKPVPKDIEDFLATAEHGAIYISFGSNLRLSTMSPHKMDQFLGALKRIPQKVLWKWENDTFPAGHDNILAKKWFSQVDVLCHPKVLAFVSHGGMLSYSEAAYCGTPLIAVPFFGDQFSNAAAIKESGMGTYIFFQDLTEESLYEALMKLTSDEMQQSAQRVSKLFHDRPMPVLDSAIYWTEYVARHRASPPSLPATRSAWFETLLLDVACFLIAIFALFVWLCSLVFKMLKYILRKTLGKLLCRQVEPKAKSRKVKAQ